MGLKDFFSKKPNTEKLRKEGTICSYNHDYENALKKFSEAADLGDAVSMVLLGNLYRDGKGTQQDNVRAFSLYKKASDAAYVWGTEMLADSYYKGIGIDVDYARAFQMAKELVHREKAPCTAMLVLAKCYLYGNGTARDYGQAFSLLNRIIGIDEYGHEALFLYAQCLENGWGTAVDNAKAMEYYIRSANSRYAPPEIQYQVACMLFEKAKTAQEYDTARLFLQYAADQGYKPADEKLLDAKTALSNELTIGAQMKKLEALCKADADSQELNAIRKGEETDGPGPWLGLALSYVRTEDPAFNYKKLGYPLLRIFSTGHAMEERIILPAVPDRDSREYYESAEDLYRKTTGNFDAILPLYEDAAKSGVHAHAMYRMYQIYDMYDKKGYRELAQKWMAKAAKAGHPIAREDPIAMIISAANGDERSVYGLYRYYYTLANRQFDDFMDERLLEIFLRWSIHAYEERVKADPTPERFYMLSCIYYDACTEFEPLREKMIAKQVFWGKKALESNYAPMQLEAAIQDAMAMGVGESGRFGLSRSTIEKYLTSTRIDHLRGTDAIKTWLETADLLHKNSVSVTYEFGSSHSDGSSPQPQGTSKRRLASYYSMTGSNSSFFVDRTRYGDEVILKEYADESVEIVAKKSMSFETDGTLYGLNGETFYPCS